MLEIFLLLMGVVAAFWAIRSKDIIFAIIILAIYSLICALIYMIMDAPDVSLTEAAVNACMSSCILLAAQKNIGSRNEILKLNYPALILCFGLFLILSYVVLDLPSYGDANAVTNKNAAQYYLSNTEKEIGIKSVVAAVLASYRGYDTLGETLVIFTAGVCVMMILGKKNATK